jgi:hypothetical protein
MAMPSNRRTLLAAADIAELQSIEGCLAAEVDRIEAIHGGSLPAIYRQFLLPMGRSAGKFLAGSDYLYGKLSGLRSSAEGLLRECNASFMLDRSDFVFLVHQGYTFLFFDSRRPDDLPIFLFEEGDAKSKQVFDHFSEWLLTRVSDEIATFKSLTHLRGRSA